MKKNIILFGGSFNPVHKGHTEIAKFASNELEAERLYFIPAKRSPFKKTSPEVADSQRIEMIKLAISNCKNFYIDTCEIDREPPSYTVDTLELFNKKLGQKFRLNWLIGSDMVADLGKWHKIEKIIELCKIVVVNRGGIEKPDFESVEQDLGADKRKVIQDGMIQTPFIDISSTEIREKISKGHDISSLVDARVQEYIRKNNLYCPENAF